MSAMARAKRRIEAFEAELADLPQGARWREWMLRVEAAIFAASEPVPRDALARLVGLSCNLDDLLADLADELRARPYDLVFVAGGYQLRTQPRFPDAIRAAVTLHLNARMERSDDTVTHMYSECYYLYYSC